ncbi:MAG: POT family proton-dependent oligopeptide transporter [Bacillariaceae sp.]
MVGYLSFFLLLLILVFGAKQYHPLLQSSLIESYYVSFYTVINVGALAGICIIPIVAQRSIFVAYLIPLSLLIIGGICFLLGTPRYICTPPRQRRDNEQLFLCGGGGGGGKDGRKMNPRKPKSTSLFEIFRICLLAVPFNVGYNQMPTTFIVQGSIMKKAFGFLDVASL